MSNLIETTINTSKQFWLNKRDIIHGFIAGVLGAIASPLLTLLETNNFSFNLKDMWHVAVMASVTHLLKSFLKPSQTIITVRPPIVKPMDDDSGVEQPPPPKKP